MASNTRREKKTIRIFNNWFSEELISELNDLLTIVSLFFPREGRKKDIYSSYWIDNAKPHARLVFCFVWEEPDITADMLDEELLKNDWFRSFACLLSNFEISSIEQNTKIEVLANFFYRRRPLHTTLSKIS